MADQRSIQAAIRQLDDIDRLGLSLEDEEALQALLTYAKEESGFHDDRLPHAYAEIDYPDMDTPEAIMGARFDDLNFMRYMER